jgi:Bacteriocin-protection, YdeI or OmpD-Associated
VYQLTVAVRAATGIETAAPRLAPAASPSVQVTVEIAPKRPQRDDPAEDIATALAANPDAGAFFAQVYRRAYLRWIEATKHRPGQRAEHIAEVVRLLKSRTRQRP